MIRFAVLLPALLSGAVATAVPAAALSPTTTAVTISPATVTYGAGATETIKVTVTGVIGRGHPTGTVTVTGNGGLGTLATIPLTSACTSINTYTYNCTGSATIAVTATPGNDTITASYGGSALYSASSGHTSLTISAATPTGAIADATTVYGGTVTLSATNTGVSGAAAPGGAATFVVNGTTAPGTPSCSSSGAVRTCTLSFTAPPSISASGTAYITSVSFAADSNYSTSTGSGGLTVNKATPTATIANETQFYGKNIGLTATNTGIGAAYAAPTGAPRIMVGSVRQSGAKTCTQAGDVDTCTATYSIRTAQTVGTYTMTVTFAGDTNYVASTGTGTLSVDLDNSSTKVSASPQNINPSGSTVLTAIVKNTNHGATTPTGTVTFTTGSTNLGNCTLASRTCSITVPGSTFGAGRSDTVTASYGGLANEIATSSGTTTVTLPADIVFTSVNHYMGTVPVGSSATYGVQLANNDATAFPFSLTLTGPSTYTVYDASCGTSVPANKTCEIVFTYTPTTTAHETATWSVTSGGLIFSPSDGGTLTGDGVASAGVTLSTGGHNFLTQDVGTISDVYGTVLSNGTATPTALTFSQTDTTDFLTFENNCPAILPAYATCNLQYEFAPQTTGFLLDQVTITATQGGSPVTITAGGVTVSGVRLDGTGQ